ncbi:MAG: hypothetical protein AAB431_00310 [Patescibacteria group bacterium]
MKRRDFFQKTQRKRYTTQTFRNPYFREPKNKKLILILGGVLLGLLCLAAGACLLLSHPRFQIKQIQVHGVQQVSHEQMDQTIKTYLNERVFLFFKRQNRFLFQSSTLSELLKKDFAFSDMTIRKHGITVEIDLTERTSHLIWQTGAKKYIVDFEGVVVRESTDNDILPLFVDRQNVSVEVGSSVLTAIEIKSVFLFQERLRTQNISFTQTQFDRLAGKWTGILTTEGYTILFDVTGDIDAQAGRLELLRKEKIKDTSKLQYVDLRFGDHVYIK